MDSISTARLEQVIPEMARKVEAMEASLAFPIRVVQGLRTVAEQDALFAQIPKVTNARGGYSMHNFGLAVDCVPSLGSLQESYNPDWKAGDERYRAMVAAGEAQGLISGSKWTSIVDWPHFQMPHLPLTPTDQMRLDIEAGGLELVWDKYRAGVY